MKTILSFLKNIAIKCFAAAVAAGVVICIGSCFDQTDEITVSKLKKELETVSADVKKWQAETRNIQKQIDLLNIRKENFDREISRLKQKGGLEKFNIPYFSIISASLKKEIAEKHLLLVFPSGKLQDQEKKQADISSKISKLSGSCLERLRRNCSRHFVSYFLVIYLVLLFEPLLKALVLYYFIAEIVEKTKPMKNNLPQGCFSNIDMPNTDPSLNIAIKPGEHFYLRGGWCKSRKNVTAKTKLMWHWNAPLITFAADLVELVDYFAEHSDWEITVTAPEPDLFIGEIDLTGTNGFVIRPKYLIGVTDQVKIKTVWSFSLHNILSGRIRQVILFGNGRIIVSGAWGIEIQNADPGTDHRIEYPMLIGYDAQAGYSLCKTETFWHYFRKEAALFDIKIQNGNFISQKKTWSYTKKDAMLIEKFLDTFLNGLGSFLGF